MFAKGKRMRLLKVALFVLGLLLVYWYVSGLGVVQQQQPPSE